MNKGQAMYLGDQMACCTPEEYKRTMRLFPAVVTIVATGHQEERCGMTATAVCSLTAEPPQVMVCLNKKAGTARALRECGCFSVNVLGHDQSELAKRFAGIGYTAFGDEKFDDAAWGLGQTGVPVLRDSVLVIECELVIVYEVATHLVVIGGGRSIWSAQNRRALMYRDGGFGTWSSVQH